MKDKQSIAQQVYLNEIKNVYFKLEIEIKADFLSTIKYENM